MLALALCPTQRGTALICAMACNNGLALIGESLVTVFCATISFVCVVLTRRIFILPNLLHFRVSESMIPYIEHLQVWSTIR